MPLHLPAIGRRAFVGQTLAGLTAGAALGAAEPRSHRWVLFSDTHIAGDEAKVVRGVNMAEHFQRAAAAALALPEAPAGALFDGDCALGKGEPSDYATLVRLIEPLRAAGWPLHFTLGNHDHRTNFWSALRTKPGALAQKHVAVIETHRANWFLLDTLDKVNVTPGRIGGEQLDWLGKELDRRPEKPALIFAHHHPEFVVPGAKIGVVDTDALFETLTPRKQVKAYIFGHTHHFHFMEHEGIHLINLPAVAYVFVAVLASGFVTLDLLDDGALVTMHALNAEHASHGHQQRLKWR